jgi:membrane protein YqaA with SNARE-associated domain
MPSLLAIGAYATAFALAYVSALVPLVNSEVLVLTYVALAGPGSGGALIVAGVVAAGQMMGKCTLYGMGRGAAKIPSERQRRAIERWGERFSRSPHAVMLFVFTSAASGFPPFYAVSVLSGTFRVNLVAFFLVGFAGRFIRFSILALFPGWLGIGRHH